MFAAFTGSPEKPVKQPTPKGEWSIHRFSDSVEVIRNSKQNLSKSSRDIDRELRAIDRQEKKLEQEIKSLAAQVCGIEMMIWMVFLLHRGKLIRPKLWLRNSFVFVSKESNC